MNKIFMVKSNNCDALIRSISLSGEFQMCRPACVSCCVNARNC